MRIGLLLPHFSDYCTWERLFGFAPRIEALGYDSVWVRDHLSYVRHGYELEGDVFIDPFVTLSAIAGATTTLGLGTAVIVPFRHPVLTGQMVGSLSWASHNRLEVGIAPGARRKPFELAGIAYRDRIPLSRDTARVLRALSQGGPTDFQGDVVSFQGVTVEPPPPQDLVIWYGGGSETSVRRAAEYADGLLPGLCTIPELKRLKESVLQYSPDRMLRIGTIPFVSMGKTREKAAAKISFALPPLFKWLSEKAKHEYNDVNDLRGAVVLGTVEECAEQISELASEGLDLTILDLRLDMPHFEEEVERIAKEVIPLLTHT